MRFFVYGRLKSDEKKSWMIPFAESIVYRLNGYKVLVRPDGAAALLSGTMTDFIDGEIRNARWANIWPLGWLLLKFLDLNEGVPWGVYERIEVNCVNGPVWLYFHKREFPQKDCKIVRKWTEGL
jgi:hypothetical protein